jgi:RTX calcium-binding nonapeptide repeat (4 copies)
VVRTTVSGMALTRILSLASLALATMVVALPAAAVTIVGSAAAERIRGTAGADRLFGRGGPDRLYGFRGNDLLNGGAGRDLLDGGRGADRFLARDGTADVVVCGAGSDTAILDAVDLARGCERVWRPVTPPTPPPAPPAHPSPSLPPPSPVALENQKPGTPGWATIGVAHGRAIEGYTTPSARPGETITFHVSAEPEASYRVLVYRIGWYGGAGARLAACLPSCEGTAAAVTQPIPAPNNVGLVHADWPVSQTLAIPGDWVSGYYLVHYLLTSGPYAGNSSVSWMLLREGAVRRAPILVQAGASTWQAYNGWGGGSLYEFNSPAGRRAAKVALDRPVERQSLRRAFEWDAPLVLFLERSGYDVSYQADVDTARDPTTLERRKALVVAGHNEYWAKAVRDGFERARAAGTSLAFFGANAAYWQVRYEDDFRTLVGYKSSAWDPETDSLLETDLFRVLVPPRYECELIGIQHQGGTLSWEAHGDYTVTQAAGQDPWLVAAGLAPGDVVKGIVSREVDTIPGWLSAVNSCGNELTVLFHRELGGDTNGNADAVRFTSPSGAKVFASGSHQFAWGLSEVPGVEEIPKGLVDERLQRLVRAMIDDMLEDVASGPASPSGAAATRDGRAP